MTAEEAQTKLDDIQRRADALGEEIVEVLMHHWGARSPALPSIPESVSMALGRAFREGITAVVDSAREEFGVGSDADLAVTQAARRLLG